jgi:hypothetical protein
VSKITPAEHLALNPRLSRNGDSGEKQFVSAQFGSGADVKGKAMELLLPRIKDLVLIDA